MNNKIKIIALIIIILLPLISEAQRWKRTRYELVAGAGPSLFFGEFGGGYGQGKRYLGDIDMQSTRFNTMIGARYKVKEDMAVKFNIIFAYVSASDDFTTNEGRAGRGASFHSPIIEQSLQFEYSLIKERFGSRYTFQNMHRFSFAHVNTYVFAGLGGFYFNPKLTYTGTGRTNKNEKFSKYNLAIPVGIGFKYGIDRRYSFGIEFGHRYTSTDYIDGWSDKFSKARDSYSFIIFNLTYKLRTARSGLPKF